MNESIIYEPDIKSDHFLCLESIVFFHKESTIKPGSLSFYFNQVSLKTKELITTWQSQQDRSFEEHFFDGCSLNLYPNDWDCFHDVLILLGLNQINVIYYRTLIHLAMHDASMAKKMSSSWPKILSQPILESYLVIIRALNVMPDGQSSAVIALFNQELAILPVDNLKELHRTLLDYAQTAWVAPFHHILSRLHELTTRPVIAITRETDFSDEPFWMLQRLGALPMLLGHPKTPPLEQCDALVIPGGDDIPMVYFETSPQPPSLDSQRVMMFGNSETTAELGCVNQALALRMPIWGICRGHQLLFVALGGKILQDVSRLIPDRAEDDIAKFQFDSNLRSAVKERAPGVVKNKKMDIFSNHTQAADPATVPNDLRIPQVARGGMIKSLELKDPLRPPVIGTQYHPETLCSYDACNRAVMQYVVDSAKRYRFTKSKGPDYPSVDDVNYRRFALFPELRKVVNQSSIDSNQSTSPLP